MTWQSPIAPGISWYQDSLGARPQFPAMDGSRTVDVAVIGGGFTGLQAAYNLARAGVSVVLIEGYRVGDGASGRNGGQFGTGQRAWPDDLEKEIGFERSKALFDIAEHAKHYVLDFAREHDIDMEFLPGQLNVLHKKSYEKDYRKSVEAMTSRYEYSHVSFMEKAETAERLGSDHYHFGVRDTGTGHIHPLKLIVGLAKAAKAAGAQIFEMTPAKSITQTGGKTLIETSSGTITADRVLIATNAHIGNLEPVTAAHVMPIRSFIGATVPLDDFPTIIPGKEAIADSRFVVRYFRKTPDNRLLFGGREAYTADSPRDISKHIRKQIAEIYPALNTIEMTHAWGGSVGITLNRQPFVREVMPGVMSIGGYSGHGVMLSNYCGKLYADMVVAKDKALEQFSSLDVPSFPGGTTLRAPLLFLALSWYALRDRF
ncbi:NAD(P)/FAD-dependent oxidoreductase [Agrobacterium rosae]|uniref:FAD-binding oxidoreductase n=1 Tax=Agrobacterium rosae TaxID=1972867 RepID=A0AAE5RXR1_9HYPH|nr:FAD-binding oxidoreductase [Agrobacterium rosae]KAA3514102.1 FAD-binding oxidoreductase [Agrobacterium rosae]KAA3522770.1 FAD-binding oxidoreductase [Agrobacterium rosae]MCM2433964.1 FAD-binding oxidoreductase [Agrobacterium rosae]MDX8330481.1 FAD-binding oxidoreductase [Agrobacterium rosae]MQB47440.1 FAD-binding oxidoreductase [Agrobacterium rosae]